MLSCTAWFKDVYLLAEGQDFTWFLEAALAALRIRLPLARLHVHVQELAAAEHGDLRLRHLRARSIHFSQSQSLQSTGRKDGERAV